MTILDWLVQTFRQNQEIPIFLTLGIGFWLGNLKFKSFSLGPVTATLIIGVLIGQMDIQISPTVKSLAFMLFLFAIGYSVGPQFFRSLKGEGLKQIMFALVECVMCIGVVVLVCRIMHFDKGVAAGLYAGSQTVSAVIGVGSDTIKASTTDSDAIDRMIHIIPACYAVTYVFGTIGSAWIIANLGPILLGGLKKVKEETRRLEEEMDAGDFTPEEGTIVANRVISYRAFRAETPFFDKTRTISEIESYLRKKNIREFVVRVRINGEIMDPSPTLRIHKGDTIVLSGRRSTIVGNTDWVGPEVIDHELLTFSSENLAVTVSRSGANGMTIGALRAKSYMHGVMISKVLRNDIPLPVSRSLRLESGDVLTLVGLPEEVANAVPEIGYSDRATKESDIVFIGLGIAIGCLIGAIVVYCKGIPLSLSTSGGAILAGLVMGWLRSRKPTFGHIPSSVVWFMDNAGLNLFIAVVGIAAGPSFITGLQEVGVSIFFLGILCTFLPLFISIYIGNKLFRFPAAITLGCVAGSRNAVAALGAIQDSLDSTLPMMGYTVTYAVGSVSMIIGGLITTLLV
ncbi:MAG: aspartate-alanine antiporter [Bacteroidales bacterium]|nr:aspartate-alanine antiporter [Bacteroidales bacterium]MBD5218275.1 aspartate-alanine antiporter [Bacteroidales bacterium]